MSALDDNAGIADVRATLNFLSGTVAKLEEACRDIPKMALAVEYITTAVDRLDRLVEGIRDPRMRELEQQIGDLRGRAAAVENTIKGPPELRAQVTTDTERVDRLQRIVYGVIGALAIAIIGIILNTIFRIGGR